MSRSEVNKTTESDAQAFIKNFNEKYFEIRNSESKRAEANPNVWITVHNSTYDMSDLSLQLCVQENYEKNFDFMITDDLFLKDHHTKTHIFIAVGIAIIACAIILAIVVRKKKKPKH